MTLAEMLDALRGIYRELEVWPIDDVRTLDALEIGQARRLVAEALDKLARVNTRAIADIAIAIGTADAWRDREP